MRKCPRRRQMGWNGKVKKINGTWRPANCGVRAGQALADKAGMIKTSNPGRQFSSFTCRQPSVQPASTRLYHKMRLSFLPRRLPPLGPSLPPLRHFFSSAAAAQPNPESTPESHHHHHQPPPQEHPPPPPNNATPTTTTTTTTQTTTTTPPTPQNQSQNPSLTYPTAPSPHHNSLPTFLAYAARANLDPHSTVYVGTHFEYTAVNTLSRYGLALRRVGGSSDGGIDLLGVWALPVPVPSAGGGVGGGAGSTPPLRVLGQCKAVQRPGPHLVRELEGAFASAPAGWRGSGVVGLLVAEKHATKGIREALARSRWPMAFVACSRAGVVEQFLWNRRAEEEGLEGFGVGMRYAGGGGGGQELVLTWKGRNLPFVRAEGESGSGDVRARMAD